MGLKNVLCKIAGIRVEDVEDRIGTYFSDTEEQGVRNLIKKEEDKSWALRHPVLSLGYGSLVSEPQAMDNIVNSLLRRDMSFRRSMQIRDMLQPTSHSASPRFGAPAGNPAAMRREMVRSLVARMRSQQGMR